MLVCLYRHTCVAQPRERVENKGRLDWCVPHVIRAVCPSTVEEPWCVRRAFFSLIRSVFQWTGVSIFFNQNKTRIQPTFLPVRAEGLSPCRPLLLECFLHVITPLAHLLHAITPPQCASSLSGHPMPACHPPLAMPAASLHLSPHGPGAFNQGFEQARFTQNYGILCPSTETEFNMKTGEVMTWLPNNAVLRLLTPPCPPLEVFPVKVEQGEVRVAVPDGGERAYFDGGATSSFERNNVFGIEPRMYLEDGTYIDDDGVTQSQLDPGIIVVTTLAVAIVAVAGTAVCLYIESIPALAAFWIVGFAIVGKQVLDYSDLGQDE